MKAIYGLILAIGLGFAAALLNFSYLNLRSRDVVQDEFIGIKKDTMIDRGRPLILDDLVAVPIPRASAGNLKKFAFLYRERENVVGDQVWRPLEGGSLLLRDDVRTPPETLKLGSNEGLLGVPFDAKSFPSSLLMPGDRVSFIFARSAINLPTLAEVDDSFQPVDPADRLEGELPPGPTETIGPFIIATIGNRMGTSEVVRSRRIPQVMGNVITIRVKYTDDSKEALADPKVQKLKDLIYSTNASQVGIQLHPRTKSTN